MREKEWNEKLSKPAALEAQQKGRGKGAQTWAVHREFAMARSRAKSRECRLSRWAFGLSLAAVLGGGGGGQPAREAVRNRIAVRAQNLIHHSKVGKSWMTCKSKRHPSEFALTSDSHPLTSDSHPLTSLYQSESMERMPAPV